MLNYTPRTWVPGETVTATELNAEIGDPFTEIQSAWDTFTPVWTTATLAPAIGNGSLTGRYRRVGQTIDFLVQLTAGSTTTFGSGQWQFTLPVAPRSSRWLWMADAFDSSATDDYSAHGIWAAGGTTVNMKCSPSTAGNPLRALNTTAPFAWANGDKLTITGRYEAA